jgi:hypothetical protein
VAAQLMGSRVLLGSIELIGWIGRTYTGGPGQGLALCIGLTRVGSSEDGDRLQSPKRRVSNKRHADGQCPEL